MYFDKKKMVNIYIDCMHIPFNSSFLKIDFNVQRCLTIQNLKNLDAIMLHDNKSGEVKL